MTPRRVLDLQAELRADEAAARAALEEAEAALTAAEGTVAPNLIDADPDEVRRLAMAVEVTRAAAVIEFRTLGVRPGFDEAAEAAALDALQRIAESKATTAAVRRQWHATLAIGNVLGLSAIGNAAVRMIVWTADPMSAATTATVLTGGALPVVAAAAAAVRTVWSARRTRLLLPSLDDALRAGGCSSVRELADQRDRVDHWERRARIAADAGDRCAVAVREWYDLAGLGADPASVDDLLARAEWYRVTRAAVERARLTHRVAAARLARAEILAAGGEPPEGADAEPASDRIQIALLRLRRGARLAWRRAS